MTEDSLIEFDDRQPVVALKRSDVKQLEIRYGLLSERPLLALTFGGLLIAAGAVALLLVLRALLQTGRVVWQLGWIVPFAFAGMYLVFTTLRRGYYLSVELPRDRRKLYFGRNVQLDHLKDFVTDARDRLDHEITIAAEL